MVHAAKAKKPKGDDAFSSKKQKVGKKKLAPVTATRAEVHAAGLRIVRPEQESLAAGKTVLEVVKSERRKPIRALRECIAETTHYRDVARAGAFAGIARYLTLTLPKQKLKVALQQRQRNPHADQHALLEEEQLDDEGNSLEVPSPLQLLSLLQLGVDRQTDGSIDARKHSLSVLRMLFEEHLPLDLVALISFVQLPLTHAERQIKSTGLELLDLLLTNYPAFATVQSIVAHQAASGPSSSSSSGAPDTAFDGEENLLESLTSAAAHAVLSMPGGSPAQRAGYTTLLHLLQRLHPLPLIGFDVTGSSVAPRYPGNYESNKKQYSQLGLRQGFFQVTIGKIFYTRLCTLWGELSDIQAGGKHVLRDHEQANFGCVVLTLLSVIGQELVAQGTMTKAYTSALKSILSRFPFSVEELTRSMSAKKEAASNQRWKLAVAMCGALIPLYGLSPETNRFVDSVLGAVGERAAAVTGGVVPPTPSSNTQVEEDDEEEEEEDAAGSSIAPEEDDEESITPQHQIRRTLTSLPAPVEYSVLELVHRLVVCRTEFSHHVMLLIAGPLSAKTEHWIMCLGDDSSNGSNGGAVVEGTIFQLLQLWVATLRAGLCLVGAAAGDNDEEENSDRSLQRISVPLFASTGGLEEEHEAMPKLFQGLNKAMTSTKDSQQERRKEETIGDVQEGLATALSVLPKCLFLLTRLADGSSSSSSSDNNVVQSIANDFARLLWQCLAQHQGSLTQQSSMASVPVMLGKLLAPTKSEDGDADDTPADGQADCMLSALGDSTVEIVAAAGRYATWGDASTKQLENVIIAKKAAVVGKTAQVFGIAFAGQV